jgi:hypothetical protein
MSYIRERFESAWGDTFPSLGKVFPGSGVAGVVCRGDLVIIWLDGEGHSIEGAMSPPHSTLLVRSSATAVSL